MLTTEQTKALEEIIENDRLMKQLFTELGIALLDDDYGITNEAYSTLCELADQFGFDIEEETQRTIGSADGRVYFKPID